MDKTPLRIALRAKTADLHEALDRQVGNFTAPEDYADYVARSFLFRSAIEANLPANDRWQVPPLAATLAQDLTDLNRTIPTERPAPLPPNTAGQMGILYVLEGSAVGARLLLKRARAIGMSERHGARHLSQQAGDSARWPQFLALLEETPASEHEDVLEASAATFRLALEAYSAVAP